MMVNMLLTEGQMVKFRNVSLPKGTYVKLQPVTSDFLDISNPKAVLERTLRSYSCLTVGDCFVVHYNNKEYEIEVREAKPGSAISIIETDCQVDFEAPKDYKEPERVPPQPAAPPAPAAGLGGAAGAAGPGSSSGAAAEEEEPEEPKFVPFVGSGRRLDGRPAASSSAPAASAAAAAAAARAGAAGSSGGGARGASSSSGTSSKAGTFVSTGNRLLDKLQVRPVPWWLCSGGVCWRGLL
jgi:ubiquitin fusion degradation protein 1